MKISIIIPIYNVAAYIRNSLLSVLNQTYKDLEIILVNDQTKDNSMDIVQDILRTTISEFPIRIINHKKNQGLSAARNTGINESTGEYLYFLDSDDEITTDCIETLVKQVEKEYPDIVIGDYRVIGSDDFYPPLRLNTTMIKGQTNILKSYVRGQFYVMAWNKLVRRSFILSNNLFFKEGIIHEDNLWSFQCACHAHKLAVIKHTTYLYKIRKNSITTLSSQEKEIKDSKTVLKEIVYYANKLHLLTNKHVTLFIEKEKLRLLHTFLRYSKTVSIEDLHTFIVTLPRPTLIQLLQYDFFHKRRLVRDAYYFLPPYLSQQYYSLLPKMIVKYAHGKIKDTLSFYQWFFCILFYLVRNRFPKEFHLPKT